MRIEASVVLCGLISVACDGSEAPIPAVELPSCGDATVGAWDPGYDLAGLSGADPIVLALAQDGDDIYAGGEFSKAGSLSVSNVARWRDGQWTALGQGLRGRVTHLAVAGATVWAAGEDPQLGTLFVARFDDDDWTVIADDVPGPLHDLAAVPTGVAVSGGFRSIDGVAAEGLAVHDGAGWSAVGVAGGDGPHAGPGSDDGFCVVGSLTGAQLGAVGVENAACWNGSGWSALGTGLPDGDLLSRAPDGTWYTQTVFPADGDPAIAFLDTDGAWKRYRDPLPVRARAIAATADGVRAAGSFPYLSGFAALLEEDATDGWRPPLDGGVSNRSSTWEAGGYAVVADAVGGSFFRVGTTAAFSIVSADGDAFGCGCERGVTGTIEAIDNTWSGDFDDSDHAPVVVGALDTVPAGYQGVGEGPFGAPELEGRSFPASIEHLAVTDGAMALAGTYLDPPLAPAFHDADGGWSDVPMGDDERVEALLVAPDRTLYLAIGMPEGRAQLRRWDGTSLDVLGTAEGFVSDMAIYEGGLVLVGITRVEGLEVHGVARWKGGGWEALGDPEMTARLVTYSPPVGLVVAGYRGGFREEFWAITAWDGAAWNTVYSGREDDGVALEALEACDDGIFVGGAFSSLSSSGVPNLAWYDGTRWAGVGDGTLSPVTALAAAPHRLFVAGRGQVAPTSWSSLVAWGY